MEPLGISADRLTRLLGEIALDGVSLLDANGAVTATSDSVAQWAGTRAEVHPDDLAEASRCWRQIFEAPTVAVRSCLRLKHPDGSWRWIESSTRNLLGDPEVKRVVVSWRDVTVARQAELALRASQDRQRLLLASAHELILRIAPGGELSEVSDSSQAVLGFAPAELVGTDFYRMVHPADLGAVQQGHALGADALIPLTTYRCRRRDQSWAWLEASARRLPEGPLVIVAREVTDRRLTDEQFLQAQKMAAVGRLAGGVAHDFNNLLSIITSAGALLQQELPPDHPSQPITEEIRAACRRAAELTRQLLAFSGRQLLVPGPVSVNDLVRAVIEEVTPQLPAGIAIVTRLDPGVGMITVDADQLERVVTGLVNNACEAMPEGGQLRFSTGNLAVGASGLTPAVDPGVGEYVRLEVEDTGVGMSGLTRAHLFEPFFTTKPRGKGLGLSLATAYGVIRQSNGHIRVQSELGEGTSFALLFPRQSAALASPAPSRPRAPKRVEPSGSELILLIEDDHAVRRVTAALLATKGYRVIQAEGGTDALALSDEELGAVALVLTDVVMPDQSGPQVAAALEARRPGLRVLFMSGYHNEALQNVLAKPFTLDTLLRRVREVLDRPAG